MNKLGLEVELLDNDPVSGSGAAGDILNDDVHNSLLRRLSSGEFFAVFAAPPCSTFSITRHFAAKGSSDGGPPLVRTREHIRGLPDVPGKHKRELLNANAIVSRLCALLSAGFSVGTQYVVENPADRGDPSFPKRFLDIDHGPLWAMPEIRQLARAAAGSSVTFPMCSFGAPWQKLTTLAYSPGFDEWLSPLGRLECSHTSHARAAGGAVGAAGVPSSETSAYPSDFNLYIANAFARLHSSPASPSPTTTATQAAASEASMPAANADATTIDAIGEPSEAAQASTADHAAEPLAEPPSLSPPRPSRSPLRDNADTDELAAASEEPPARNDVRRGLGQQATRSTRPTLAAGLGKIGLNGRAWASLARAALVTVAVSGGAHGFAALAKPSAADPLSQAEAYRADKPGWQKSELKEIANHESNGSWEWVKRSAIPRGRSLIKFVWVYKIKRDGSFKSRLCVQGCRQVAGVDYNQTWCGTMRGASLRMLSAVAAREDMKMRRWDFVAAYLQGELEDGEVVYCRPPPGYSKHDENGNELVCKVVKPVYGMAQAGRRWQRTLYPWLREFGFTSLDSDPSVFTVEREMTTPSGPRLERLHLGVYVDDLAVSYLYDDAHSLYAEFATALQKRWNVEDEGDVHDLLGIEFDFGKSTITLHQASYIEKLAKEFFPDGVPSSSQANKVPCDQRLPLLVLEAMSQESDVDAEQVRRFQSIVGALLYCSGNTRPDVTFAVSMLCRCMSRPTTDTYEAALRVLAYLYRTRRLGLRYEADSRPLRGQSDSDWATKHSTTGWQFTFSQAVVSWGSKKQVSVALSSCEAEIMAASEAAKEAIYLSRFLRELGYNDQGPVELGMDNQSAIAISYNPELHSRTKHIDRRHFFVRECVENHQITVPFVKTIDNLADFFTKPLPGKTFFAMRDQLMNVPSSAREELTADVPRAAVASSESIAHLEHSGAEPRVPAVRAAPRHVSFAESVDVSCCRVVRRNRRCHVLLGSRLPSANVAMLSTIV